MLLSYGKNENAMANLAPVSVRMTASERDLLEAAAEQSQTNLSDFIRRKAVEAAELALMDRRVVTIPAEHWEKFEAWVNSPPRDLPNLRKRAAKRPVWED
jgi:uncharacterized protein (DUF1778 family)